MKGSGKKNGGPYHKPLGMINFLRLVQKFQERVKSHPPNIIKACNKYFILNNSFEWMGYHKESHVSFVVASSAKACLTKDYLTKHHHRLFLLMSGRLA